MSEELRQRVAKFPRALEPIYSTQSPNAPIILYHGQLRVTIAPGQVATGPGKVELRWLPHPSIWFVLSESKPLPAAVDLPSVTLEIVDLDIECRAFLTGMSHGAEVTYKGIIESTMNAGEQRQCGRVLFHLPNYFSVTGEHVQDDDSRFWRGRLEMETNDLRLTLDALRTSKDLIDDLKAERGFGLTHTGVLERVAGDSLSFDQAGDALSAVHWYLSFCRGLWCSPTLAVGQVGSENVWELWSHPKATPWKYVETWFPHGDMFDRDEHGKAFEGFLAKWSNQLWKEPLKHVIHWYVEANLGAGGIEGSIVLIQTALELLAWVYLVEDRATKQHSNTKFNKKMSAAQRIRDLMSTLDVPIDIPSELSNLLSAASLLEATDGPEAVVKLRNAIVHPKRSKRKLTQQASVSARMEARELGLWYVEMALLRIFGYEGQYYQRFLGGYSDDKRAQVPWAQHST